MSDYWTKINKVAQVFDGPHATPKKIEEGPYFLSISSLEKGTLDLTKSAHLSEKDFIKWTKRVTPQEGDVLFSYETRLGDAALMPGGITACLGRRMGLLRPIESEVIPEYLLYAYLSPAFQETIRANTIHGATVDRIALRDMPNYPIRIPPFEEQRRVVEILKALDSKIELNRQTNQTLEQIAQALFKSWFVDFDPVKAKIAAKQAGSNAEQIERAAMAAISGKTEAELDQLTPEQTQNLKTTATLFPDELVDSELGEIPFGWEVSKIKDFGNVVCGKTPSKAKSENYGNFMPFIKIPDMHETMFVVEPIECLSEEGVHSQPKKIIPEGSICVSCIATVGKVVITHQNSQTNQQINSIVPFEESSSYYLYFYMTGLNQLFNDLASGGSATLNMNTSTFSNINLLKPNTEILKKFHKSISPILKQVLSNLEENRNLEGLRNTLLPKLLSGQIEL